MLKSIFLKKLLINTVFKAASAVNKIIPKNQNKILLYSNEGFRDNIFYLYQYLIEHQYQEKYQIICSTSDYAQFRDVNISNVQFVSNKAGILHFFSSSAIYYCFGRIPIVPSGKQAAVQMWHGTSFKGFDQTMQKTNSLKNQFYTHVFASSEFFRPIVQKKFSCKPEAVYLCGHPRTDCFYTGKNLYSFDQYKKVIVWMPTFRKSAALGYADTHTDNTVPFFRTDELAELEQFAKERNILLLVKFHPMQDVHAESIPSALHHVQLLTHQKFSAQFDLYELLKQTDALITDYSSVFYDYLLLDRPIGFTEDDEAEYSSSRGFAVENPDEFKPGMRISTKADFYRFISDVAEGIDKFKEKRAHVNALSNQYQDGQNCRRALAAANIHLNQEETK